jgi:hypothetical protein
VFSRYHSLGIVPGIFLDQLKVPFLTTLIFMYSFKYPNVLFSLSTFGPSTLLKIWT